MGILGGHLEKKRASEAHAELKVGSVQVLGPVRPVVPARLDWVEEVTPRVPWGRVLAQTVSAQA